MTALKKYKKGGTYNMYTVSSMIDEIVRHAAIGYYLGENIPVEVGVFEDVGTSFYSPEEYKIYIHKMQFDQVKKEFDTPEEAEKAGRTTLYHEVCHAIMTPVVMKVNDIINIFEDERIETLVGPIFINVDFWKQRFWINGMEPGEELPEEDPMQKFYNLVRFHNGPKEFLNRVTNIIARYQFDRNYEYYSDIEAYVEDVLTLFTDYCGPIPPGMKPAGTSRGRAVTPGSEGARRRAEKDKSDPGPTAPKPTNLEAPGGEDGESTLSHGGVSPEDIKKALDKAKGIIERVVDTLDDNPFLQPIEMLLSTRRKAGEHGGSAGYSGKLNVRQFSRPDHKYKFWTKPYGNSQNQYEDIHFVLWIDESGSFASSAPVLNSMIRCLNKCSRKFPFFTFDVITVSMDFNERKKGHEWIRPSGGNCIPKKGYEIYRRHRKQKAMNYDIVVFDGDAISDCKSDGPNMGIWNHNNCIIVTDRANQGLVERYAPQAKSKILCSDYAEEFTGTIISMLNQLIK